MRALLLLGFLGVSAGHQPATPAFDCQMRGLLYERAQQLLAPSRAAERLAVFEALQLGASCNVSRARALPAAAAAGSDFALGRPAAPGSNAATAAATVYVATWGHDGGRGSQAEPFATPERAREAARAVVRAHGEHVSILLRCRAQDGPRCVFHLNHTLVFGPEDSFTRIGAEPGAGQVVISGGVPLTRLQWQAVPDEPRGLQKTTLPTGLDANFSSLFVNGQRAVRARTPNGNMERSVGQR